MSWLKQIWVFLVPLLSKVNAKSPAWLTIIVAILSIAGTMYFGGEARFEIKGANGNVYGVTPMIAEGIDDLIKDYNLKVKGDSCTPKAAVKIELLEVAIKKVIDITPVVKNKLKVADKIDLKRLKVSEKSNMDKSINVVPKIITEEK